MGSSTEHGGRVGTSRYRDVEQASVHSLKGRQWGMTMSKSQNEIYT